MQILWNWKKHNSQWTVVWLLEWSGLNAGHKFTVGDQKVRLKVTAGEDAVGWQLLCPVMSSMKVGHPFIYDNCSEVQLQLKMF